MNSKGTKIILGVLVVLSLMVLVTLFALIKKIGDTVDTQKGEEYISSMEAQNAQDIEQSLKETQENMETTQVVVDNPTNEPITNPQVTEPVPTEPIVTEPVPTDPVIIPTEPAFKELIMVLTGADDVELRYSEDIACGITSKKYRVIEDIIVIKNQEPKSLKYSHPDIIRLFDRFNISVKMINKKC